MVILEAQVLFTDPARSRRLDKCLSLGHSFSKKKGSAGRSQHLYEQHQHTADISATVERANKTRWLAHCNK